MITLEGVDCGSNSECLCKVFTGVATIERLIEILAGTDSEFVYLILTGSFFDGDVGDGKFWFDLRVLEDAIIAQGSGDLHDLLPGITEGTEGTVMICSQQYLVDAPDVDPDPEPSIELNVTEQACGECLEGGIMFTIAVGWSNLLPGELVVVHGTWEGGELTWNVNNAEPNGTSTQDVCVPELSDITLWATTETIETTPIIFESDGCVHLQLTNAQFVCMSPNLNVIISVDFQNVSPSSTTEIRCFRVLLDSDIQMNGDLGGASGTGTVGGSFFFNGILNPGEEVEIYAIIAGVESNRITLNVPEC